MAVRPYEGAIIAPTECKWKLSNVTQYLIARKENQMLTSHWILPSGTDVKTQDRMPISTLMERSST
jgi:hypothetical protein